MTPRQLFVIVFIEGFCSLGAEVLALRQLIPHTGSTIVVTAPTIGFFLLALALGYHAGAQVAAAYVGTVSRNFILSACIAALGLAGNTVDAIFAYFGSPVVGYLVFVGGVLCPLAYLLGQTVPVLTNLMRHERVGEKSGYALFHSTLGSFLSAVILSLLVMQWLGVSAAVMLVAGLLFIGALILLGPTPRALAMAGVGLLLTVMLNQRQGVVGETAYATYSIADVALADAVNPRAFKVNNSLSSLIDENQPPRYASYIRHIRRLLLDQLGYQDRDILVLGAGGFTLSHDEPRNRYTYVDVDPEIRQLAETHFLKEKALGEFIVDDARHFVRVTERRFDAIVVDVYTAQSAIPAHMVTQEFWVSSKRALKPEGVMVANLILDGKMASPYARNLLATIESVYGRCGIDLLHRGQSDSNVVVSCFNGSVPAPAEIYIDEKNRADTDVLRSNG
ncbi:MAG: fused MFS/spermidine synthase [Rhodocyclaceae bacterium]